MNWSRIALVVWLPATLSSSCSGSEEPMGGPGESIETTPDATEIGAAELAFTIGNEAYEGQNVTCTAQQGSRIQSGQDRAADILQAVDDELAGIFVEMIFPGPTPSPERARFVNKFGPALQSYTEVREKLKAVSEVVFDNRNSCHDGDQLVTASRGEQKTCDELRGLKAATTFTGTRIRWCPYGLELNATQRAYTIIHELSHQDRTAGPSGGRVTDTSPTPHLNAHTIEGYIADVTGIARQL